MRPVGSKAHPKMGTFGHNPVIIKARQANSNDDNNKNNNNAMLFYNFTSYAT